MKNKTASKKLNDDVTLFPCVPIDWLWLPKPIRLFLAFSSAVFFSISFLIVPISVIGIPILWFFSPKIALTCIAALVISLILPQTEWKEARKFGQLWYELFDFHCNLSPAELEQRIINGNTNQYAMCMHPHGIIPLQAILWATYCDQYMSSSSGSMYGFGATADIVMYLPILRNIMGWLTAGSATYSVLKNGLEKGICAAANRVGRKPRHLYILPGGVAEIFVSTPGKHAVIFKNRRGLCKLALETGCYLTPCYVFGGTDFFNNLATGDGFLSELSRKYKMGLTIFWGRFGLPIPYTPKVTMCIADPLPCKKWEGPGEIPENLIDELHKQYLDSIVQLFNKYKSVAGHPNAQLDVL